MQIILSQNQLGAITVGFVVHLAHSVLFCFVFPYFRRSITNDLSNVLSFKCYSNERSIGILTVSKSTGAVAAILSVHVLGKALYTIGRI